MTWVVNMCDVSVLLSDSANSCSVDNGGCSYECTNTHNGTVCTCAEGYQLLEDRKTCVGESEVLSVHILVTLCHLVSLCVIESTHGDNQDLLPAVVTILYLHS